MIREDRGKRWEPALLLVVILAFCSITSTWLPIRTVPASDFYQFWVVGQELAAGRTGDIYTQEERDRIGAAYLDRMGADGQPRERRTALQRSTLETYSTPFLYTVFGALSSGDYERDLARYRLSSLAAVVLAVGLLCRLLGYGWVSTFALVAIFGSWFAPARSDWFVGNVNSFQLAAIAIFVWLSRRFPTTIGNLAGGLLLGASAMFKPNVALVVVLLLAAWGARRQDARILRTSAGLGLSGLAAFAWSSARFGDMAIWRSWFSALSRLPGDIITFELGNYAPSRLLFEGIGFEVGPWIAVLCGGLVLGAIAHTMWRDSAVATADRIALEEIHVVGLAGLVTLLASPLAWLHYFVAVIPMLLVVMRPVHRPIGRDLGSALRITFAWFAFVAVLVRPLVLLDIGDDHGRAILLCLGTAALFALGIRSLLDLGLERGSNSLSDDTSIS